MAAGRFAKGKIKCKESLLAAIQLEVTLRTRKASVTAFEVDFEECKTLIVQLFPKVDIGLLEISDIGVTNSKCLAIEGASRLQHAKTLLTGSG